MRVLIVEDEFLVSSFIADVLEEAGYEVGAIVLSGEAAVEHLKGGGVDLAILDVRLQGTMTGIEVALFARARSIPHLFVSGSGDPVTRSSAEATAPLAFLQKPICEEDLLKVMAKLAADIGEQR